MRWFYKEIYLNRKQAEARILALNFKPAKTARGWEIVLKGHGRNKGRFHIVPPDNYMEVHQDTVNHKIRKGVVAEYKCRRIIEKLNKHNKFIVFLKKLLK